MAQTDRLRCVVPHCRRSIASGKVSADHNQWICSKHWSATPKHWRRRLFLFRRRGRADLEASMWERLKRRAIEIAVGI